MSGSRKGDVASPERMTTAQAAAELGYSENTLARWRKLGVGPEFEQDFNGRISYRLEAVKAFRNRPRKRGGGARRSAQ